MGLPTIVDEIRISDAHRREAINRADTSHCDSDMGRDEEDHKIDACIGMLGEVVGESMLEQTDDLTVKPASDNRWDYRINGQKVELKARKTWNYTNPDLLVRTKFDLAARYYIQIDLSTASGDNPDLDLSNVTHAEIVGFVTKDEVEKHGKKFTPNNKKNPTLLVPRQRLRPLHEFHAYVA